MAKRRNYSKRSRKYKRKTRSSAELSRLRSRNAHRQNRDSRGRFCGGFKTKMVSSKTHASTRSRSSKSSSSKKSVKKRSYSGSTASRKKYTPKMKRVERVLEFDCPSTTKDAVVSTIADNFSKDEIDKIDSLGKPIVTVDGNIDRKRNAYERVTIDDPDKPPRLIINHPDESSITHEMIHHMRTVDKDRSRYSKTAYSVDGKGVVNKKTHPKLTISRIKNAEETATTAETEIRLKNDTDWISSYWNLRERGVDPYKIREKDRIVLRTTESKQIPEGENVTGKGAVDLLNKNYPKTMISGSNESYNGGEKAYLTYRTILDARKKRRW